MDSSASEDPHLVDDPVAPVSAGERFSSMDMLRGVAVLGILVMNIYGFAMPFAAYTNPMLMGGTDPLNLGVWMFTHVVADQKFMSIFAMLFGAGLILMMERAAQKGARLGRLYFRRQFWLLVIGLVHGYLIWIGDILFSYALMGMFVYPFRNHSPRALVVVACCMLPVALLTSAGISYGIEQMQSEAVGIERLEAAGRTLTEEQRAVVNDWQAMQGFLLPDEEVIRNDLAAYSGGYLDNLAARVPFTASMQTQSLLVFILWRVAPLMMIGMALMKLRVFTGERSLVFYRRLMLAGYLPGFVLTVFSAWNSHQHGFEPIYMFRVGMVPNYVGSILVALGHTGLVMLIYKSGAMGWLMRRFTAGGRMALTNYLMHSIVMTSIFYGFGLGLYGSVSRIGQMGFVIALIAVQLWLSPWWLQRYRFGPVEWLWRSLTYWRVQPMRGR